MRRLALENQPEDDISALRRWWSKKYNRPRNDPELLSMTSGALISVFYRDLHERRDDIKRQIREGGHDRVKLEEVLTMVENILEIKSSLLQWQEEVEDALEAGTVPDWVEGLE